MQRTGLLFHLNDPHRSRHGSVLRWCDGSPLRGNAPSFGLELQILGRRLRIVAVALLLQAALCAYATTQQGEAEGCSETLLKRDPIRALNACRPLAERGDANAQNNLGVLYQKGWGVPQDDANAASWFRRAAERGYPLAEANLAAMYHNGWGVPQDDTEAAKWYRKAAEQGYASAQLSLGVMYFRG